MGDWPLCMLSWVHRRGLLDPDHPGLNAFRNSSFSKTLRGLLLPLNFSGQPRRVLRGRSRPGKMLNLSDMKIQAKLKYDRTRYSAAYRLSCVCVYCIALHRLLCSRVVLRTKVSYQY